MGLKLSRRETESIRIGPDVVITIVNVKGGSVSLEIDAPGNVPILLDKTIRNGTLESMSQDRLMTSTAQDRANAVRENPDHVEQPE